MDESEPGVADRHRDGNRSRFTGRRTSVAIGDVLVVFALVVGGAASHGTDPITAPLEALEVAAPFVVGWLAVAWLPGLYAEDALEEPIQAARLTAVAWLAAVTVGLIGRSSPYLDGAASWPFPLVMAAAGLVVLVPWRIGCALFFDG